MGRCGRTDIKLTPMGLVPAIPIGARPLLASSSLGAGWPPVAVLCAQEAVFGTQGLRRIEPPNYTDSRVGDDAPFDFACGLFRSNQDDT